MGSPESQRPAKLDLAKRVIQRSQVSELPRSAAIDPLTSDHEFQKFETSGSVFSSKEEYEAYNDFLLKASLDYIMSFLSDREKQVFQLRNGLDDGRSRTQKEVGEEIRRSPRTVRRIEKSIKDKLSNPLPPQD